MWYTNIYSNLIVYQKYIGTSIKVGCATRSLYASLGQKAEGVPTNNQRGRGSGPCRLCGGLDKDRHIVQTALLVRVQRIRNDLYNAVKGPSTRPIVLSMITGSYCRRRKRFTIFEPDEMKFDSFLTHLSLFESVELACRIKSKMLQFGGIQVVFVGDFAQLPPVRHLQYGDIGAYAFESAVLPKHSICLTKSMRQRDLELCESVNSVSIGRLDDNIVSYINSLSRPIVSHGTT